MSQYDSSDHPVSLVVVVTIIFFYFCQTAALINFKFVSVFL